MRLLPLKWNALLLIFIFFNSCNLLKNNNPLINNDEQILYTTSSGVYIFDLTTRNSELLLERDNLFLPYRVKSNFNEKDVIFGKKTTPENSNENQFNFYYFNNTSKELWKFKTYLLKKQEYHFNIIITQFSNSGNINFINDTLVPCDTFNVEKKIVNCNEWSLVLKNSTITSKEVFSRKGNVYLKENGKEELIIESDNTKGRRVIGGYVNPQLSNNQQKIIVQYSPNLVSDKAGIYEVDLETKNLNFVLAGKENLLPKYAKNDDKIMIARNKRMSQEGYWIYDLFVYNLLTKREFKVAEEVTYFEWIK
ncbi:MAG: hypothetical protein CVT95_03005 [Bacteroidetes bacterium HGW-Bacteroidetes-12]|nr:MAG: hypothetical protein CVT95_03005 [Bacteroidetes bacterium HGW-Bacteroidetes-12]